jgi:hypothetical protein
LSNGRITGGGKYVLIKLVVLHFIIVVFICVTDKL